MMNPTTESLKKLQVQFLTSAARWANYGTEIEPTSVDLPNVVCLLQCMGYTLRRIDSTPPDEIPLLRDGQNGTRVVITCGYSGQRCFLELPDEPEQCKCLVKAERSKDSFWEVTATNASSKRNSSLVETGSDTVPSISKEMSILIRNMLNFLIHMIQGTLEEVEDNLSRSTNSLHSNTSRGATSSPKKDAKRLSGFIKELVNPPIIISSPKGMESASPARYCRYRSLDTLTKDPDEMFPTPKPLTPRSQIKTNIDISQSSPIINVHKNEFTNSSGSTIADSNTEKVIQLLNQAVVMLKTSRSQNVSPATPHKQATFVAGPNLAVFPSNSTANLNPADKKKTYSVKATTNGAPTESNPRPIMGTGTLPMLRPIVKPKGSKPANPNTAEERNKKVIQRPRKAINLYSHIRSTIPKPSPVGKFVAKNV